VKLGIGKGLAGLFGTLNEVLPVIPKHILIESGEPICPLGQTLHRSVTNHLSSRLLFPSGPFPNDFLKIGPLIGVGSGQSLGINNIV
jgi:hypothetical protein